MFMNLLIKKDNSKNIFNKIKNDISNIEERRQYLQQLILYIVCDCNLYMAQLDIKENIDNVYGIVNLGSGYCIWTNEIINKYFKLIKNNKLYIYNIDINKNILNNNNNSLNFIIDLKKEDLPSKNMDFIYHRDMITVYENKEWNHIINQIYNSLKIKGYSEFIEYDFIVKNNEYKNIIYTNIINNYLTDIFKKNDYEYNIYNIFIKIKQYFRKVEINKIKLPLYYESKYEGICVENLIMGYSHFKDGLNNILGHNIDFENYLNLLKKEWEENKSYMELYIIIAQK